MPLLCTLKSLAVMQLVLLRLVEVCLGGSAVWCVFVASLFIKLVDPAQY